MRGESSGGRVVAMVRDFSAAPVVAWFADNTVAGQCSACGRARFVYAGYSRGRRSTGWRLCGGCIRPYWSWLGSQKK